MDSRKGAKTQSQDELRKRLQKRCVAETNLTVSITGNLPFFASSRLCASHSTADGTLKTGEA